MTIRLKYNDISDNIREDTMKTHAALISANTMYNKNGTRLGLSFEMGTLYYKLNETTESLENRPYHPCERFYLTSIDVVDCIGGLYDIELLPGGMKFGSPFVGPDVVVTWEDEESLKYKMDVDEDPPDGSLVSEDQPNDASSVPSNEEPSNDARAPSAASLDNKNDDDAGLDLTWTGDGWHTVLSRRMKNNHKQSQKQPEKGLEKKNEKSAAHPPVDAALDSHVKLKFQRRKRRGPTPLPKEDIKVILRLHKGLTVKNLFGSELSMAVIEACRNSFGGESFLLRVHPGMNIIILSTPHEQVAGRLREINQLKIRGRIYPFNAYVADPEDVLRGIVHGLPPGTTQADLMANLRIRTQGGKIERVRMLGSSKSAIITFTDDVLPRVIGDVVITDWKRYRRRDPSPYSVPESIGELSEYIISVHKQTSKRIARTAETSAVDRHLLHLWESRRRMLKRWKNQRLNRNLLRRIAALGEEANQYANKIATEVWIQLCSSLQDTLSTAKT
ncbi:hypothetical protein HPB51_018198 [Rhipicephalus microplus]|uniref:Uncharacterized protein n=1 Tax=Rhipicephalus microplus TaxID=6941 RepID=A0A9J6E325_RHIMP|nr:hypothetical protein HPB51_018198 [Rhipicephalus microplus]